MSAALAASLEARLHALDESLAAGDVDAAACDLQALAATAIRSALQMSGTATLDDTDTALQVDTAHLRHMLGVRVRELDLHLAHDDVDMAAAELLDLARAARGIAHDLRSADRVRDLLHGLALVEEDHHHATQRELGLIDAAVAAEIGWQQIGVALGHTADTAAQDAKTRRAQLVRQLTQHQQRRAR